VVQGDAFDPDSLRRALNGIDVAFYLIHSLGLAEGWQEQGRQAAENFGRAAADAGVDRIVYLGGWERTGPCRSICPVARR
jgi:uncharacterized protein YbjT (DUF2867 family)